MGPSLDAVGASERLRASGLPNSDFYSVRTDHLAIETQNGRSVFREGEDKGFSIRAIVNGKVVFYFGTDETSEGITNGISQVGQFRSLHRGEAPEDDCLPSSTPPSATQGLLDDQIVKDPLDTAAKISRDMRLDEISACNPTMNLFLEHSFRTLSNSNNYEIFSADTRISLLIEASPREGRRFLIASRRARTMRDLDTRAFREALAPKLATAQLPIVRGGISCQLILAGAALGDFLENLLSKALSVRSIRTRGSFIAGKIGDAVASKEFSVVDDGTAEGGANSSSFDGDGYPKRRTTLIEKGVLRNYLYDAWYSKHDGTNPSGSVSRDNYDSLPQVSTSNIQTAPGATSFESLLSELRTCAVIEEAKFVVEPGSGEAYALVDFGYVAQKGTPVGLISGTFLRLNCVRALLDIQEVSRDDLSNPGWVTPGVLFAPGSVHIGE